MDSHSTISHEKHVLSTLKDNKVASHTTLKARDVKLKKTTVKNILQNDKQQVTLGPYQAFWQKFTPLPYKSVKMKIDLLWKCCSNSFIHNLSIHPNQ